MKFQDPPTPNRGINRASIIDAEIAALKERPGEWALVRQGVFNGNMTVYKRRGCDTTSRRQPDGKFDIYARWPAP